MALYKWIQWLYFHGLGGSATMEYSVLKLFDISFDKVDEGVRRVSKVETELYEIALDIYDQLCLDQDDQDKRELKDYMERRFLNQK